MGYRKIVPVALAALLALGAAGTAYARSDEGQEKRDSAMLAASKVTLTQAIATAEQQTGGRAVGADLSQENGIARIAVEIVGPQGVKTVMVDAQTGAVTATLAEQDHEDND